MGAPFYIAFVIGISSSFHCIGMCGPIAAAIPTRSATNFGILFKLLQYHIGRIFTYSILGLVVGNIGLTLATFGALQWISIISGMILIAFAWKKYFINYFSWRIFSGISSFVSKGVGKVLRSNSPFKLVSLGILNGLLPCGMVFIALTNALLTGNPTSSATAMIFFGLGTLPAMIAVGFMLNKISLKLRSKMNKALPYLLTVVGLMIILRGMNLDIPYLSPKIEVVSEEMGIDRGTVKMNCCNTSRMEECETSEN